MTRAFALSLFALAGCTNTITTVGDLAAPDFAPENSDLAARADLAALDFAAPRDLAQAPNDLAAATNDLTAQSNDLAHAPNDLSQAPQDLSSPADLACSGPCTNPPANDCQGATARAFPNPGSCNAGQCDYPPFTTSCQYGCYQGVCSAQLSFVGNRAAFQTGTANSVGLVGGSAPSTNSVSVIVQTYPHGAAQMVQLFYTTDNFASTNPLTMLADPNTPPGNNDQWYAIIPAQSMGTHIIWYLLATGWDGTQIYDSNGGANYDYTSN
ncbi:MAG TPA: hypothetical protein VFF06_27705 [Polyangia bacterium]|nr:hypothetical protein [Polyangia bacterium]